MPTQADVRRIAMALPGAEESSERFAFSVQDKGKSKGFVWVWRERLEPKQPRVSNPKVIAVRVANLAQKDMVLASDRKKFFTEPHYNGFPAVLVRLDAVTIADLKMLIEDAWRCQAPKEPKTKAAKKPAAKKKTATRKPAAKKATARKPAAKRRSSGS
jgi:hypothetical protein